MDFTITVRYFGLIRLLISKREEKFSFSGMPTLNGILERIGGEYGEEIKKECFNQVIVVEVPGRSPLKCRLPAEGETVLENGSLVKILNKITGG